MDKRVAQAGDKPSWPKQIVSPVAGARALFDWEVDHIRSNPQGRSSGSPVATLASRTGICSDFVELYVALGALKY